MPDQGVYVTRPCSKDQPISTQREFWQRAVRSVIGTICACVMLVERLCVQQEASVSLRRYTPGP